MGWSSFLRHVYLERPALAGALLASRDRALLARDLLRARGSLERAGWRAARCCAECGLDARIPGVVLDEAGRCAGCVASPSPPAPLEPAQLRALLPAPAGRRDADAVVGVSGGKDSLLTLELAVHELGLRVEGVLVDNGFLVDEAVLDARRWCDRLGVPLTIVRRPMAAEVRRGLASRRLVPWPCHVCFDALASALVERALGLGAPWILLGLRYRWPGSGSALAPAEVAFAPYAAAARARGLTVVSLPAALAWDEGAQRERLARAGWSDPGLGGHSSNCLLPATFERAHLERLGRPHASLAHVAAEARAGAIDRATAVARAAGAAPSPAHAAELARRLAAPAPEPGA